MKQWIVANFAPTPHLATPIKSPKPNQHPINSYHSRTWVGVGKVLVTGS